MTAIKIQIVPHGSPAYWETIELRREILRLPLGLDFDAHELEAESNQFHFAAFRGSHLLGCLVMAPQNCSVVKMRQVAVRPELQRSGIGRFLVEASETWARAEGYTQIELHARDTAIPFYLKQNYTTSGPPFVEVSIPHLKMVKDLPPTPE